MSDFYQYKSLDAQKALVRVLTQIIGNDVGNFKYEDGNGGWQTDTDSPAIYIGYQEIPTPDYPLVYVVSQGSTNQGAGVFDHGLNEEPDPDNAGETITTLYTSRHKTYSITLVCRSSTMTKVARGEYPPAEDILNKVLEYLDFKIYKDLIRDEMQSGVDLQQDVIPSEVLDDGKYFSQATVTLPFETISTVFDRTGNGWFDTVKTQSDFYNINDDSDLNRRKRELTADTNNENTE